MANVTITLGAPSLTGKDCVNLVTQAFGSSSYPLSATVKNLMPSPKHFAQANGFYVGHVADKTHCEATAKFESFDDIKDFASQVCQISELNGYETALSITADGTEIEDEETLNTVGLAKVGQAAVGASTKSSAKARTKAAQTVKEE